MTIYVTTDAVGRITGAYSTDVHSAAQIPAAAVEISDALYRDWLGDQSLALVGGAMVAPPIPIEEARAAKIAELRAACAAEITGGFESDALGTVHTYPSGQTDQINLMGSVVAAQTAEGQAPGWSTPFWCADSAGAWGWVAHTAAEITAVGLAGKAHVVAAQTKLAALAAEAEAAADAAALAAITWES